MSRYAPAGGVGQVTRRCGDVTVRCHFDDRSERYVCRLSVDGRGRGTQYVGVPSERNIAVDAPGEFDAAARAAISFALADHKIDDSECHFGEAGPVVHRRKRRRTR